MDVTPQNGNRIPKAPPYVSYKTFRTFLEDMHSHGLPGRIDYSVLGRFSGTVRTQLMTALRVLDLLDGDDRPSDALRGLATTFGTDAWQGALKDALAKLYDPVFAIKPEHATPSQLNEAFRAYPTASDEVRRKCIVFFLSAAQDAGITISKRILDSNRRGVGNASKRCPKEPKPEAASENGRSVPDASPSNQPGAASESPTRTQPPPQSKPSTNPHRAAYDALSAIWAPGEMAEEVDDAVVTVLRYLRKKETEPKV